MSKFRSLKKKLLAVLCAFASGVSGASADLGDKCDGNNVLDVEAKELRSSKSFQANEIGDLEKFVIGILGLDNWHVIGKGNLYIGNNCKLFGSIQIRAVKNKEGSSNGMLEFRLFISDSKIGGGCDMFKVQIPIEFVVDKLNIKSHERCFKYINTEWFIFNYKAHLIDIIFKDILNLQDGRYEYSIGCYNFKFTKSLEYELLDVDEFVPNFIDQLMYKGGLLEDCWEFKNGNFRLDEPKIWRKLTSKVKPGDNDSGSDYYKTYKNGLGPVLKEEREEREKRQKEEEEKRKREEERKEEEERQKEEAERKERMSRMSRWLKAGMGVLGVGTAGGIGYVLFDDLIRRPKEKEVLDRKLAEDKAENLVRETEVEGKKASKKAKGNGASKGKTRQVKEINLLNIFSSSLLSESFAKIVPNKSVSCIQP